MAEVWPHITLQTKQIKGPVAILYKQYRCKEGTFICWYASSEFFFHYFTLFQVPPHVSSSFVSVS